MTLYLSAPQNLLYFSLFLPSKKMGNCRNPAAHLPYFNISMLLYPPLNHIGQLYGQLIQIRGFAFILSGFVMPSNSECFFLWHER